MNVIQSFITYIVSIRTMLLVANNKAAIHKFEKKTNFIFEINAIHQMYTDSK